MNSKMKKVMKIISAIVVILALMAILTTPVLAESGGSGGGQRGFHVVVDTIGKFLVRFARVLVTGWFVIRVTWEAIRYFSATSINEKTAKKNNLQRVIIFGTLAILGMYLVSYFLGF